MELWGTPPLLVREEEQAQEPEEQPRRKEKMQACGTMKTKKNILEKGVLNRAKCC